MKRHAPEVRQFMTRLPVEAEGCETIAEATALMQKHQVHHLPVMSGSHLRGTVSLPDLIAASGHPNKTLTDICRTDVIKVHPLAPIDEVVGELLAHQRDHAVIMDAGFVVGIFTTTDALRFIHESFGQTDS